MAYISWNRTNSSKIYRPRACFKFLLTLQPHGILCFQENARCCHSSQTGFLLCSKNPASIFRSLSKSSWCWSNGKDTGEGLQFRCGLWGTCVSQGLKMAAPPSYREHLDPEQRPGLRPPVLTQTWLCPTKQMTQATEVAWCQSGLCRLDYNPSSLQSCISSTEF